MTKVAILIASNFHEEETASPRDYLHKRGIASDIIAPERSPLSGKKGQLTMTPDLSIDQARPGDYAGLIIPGGGAPERLRLDRRVLEFIKTFWETGRPVAAICHGPQVLISADLLRGVQLTAYPGIRDDLVNAGANYVDVQVCIDGQLITSRRPDDLPAFNEALHRALTAGFLQTDEADLDGLAALELAINREKGANDFYSGVAEILDDSGVANKFRYLADVESEHFEQLSEFYRKISGGDSPRITESASEIGKARVSPGITSKEAVELAISAEGKAYDFYRNAAVKSKHDKVREMFEFLAAEEIEHKRLLLVDKASTEGGRGHFQWATHFDIPPGMEDLW